MDSEIVGEDFLDFKCPHCGALNSFPTSAAGRPRECMNCLEPFLVPTTDGGIALIIPLPYETPKIRLRRFKPTDWKDLLEFEFDDEDQATGWLHEIFHARLTEVRKTFWLAVENFNSEKVIGNLGLDFVDDEYNQARIYLSSGTLAKASHLIPDAYRAALGFCFEKLQVHRVATSCSSNERETRELLIQSGLRQEAEFVKNQYISGNWVNTFWFAMLEEEFFKNKSSDGRASTLSG